MLFCRDLTVIVEWNTCTYEFNSTFYYLHVILWCIKTINFCRKEEITKVLPEEGYFGSEKENKDVEDFIQSNTHCDIIDLLTSYLKSLSSKWQLLWPTSLPAVFIQAYECMRYVCNTHSYGFCSYDFKECVCWGSKLSSSQGHHYWPKFTILHRRTNFTVPSFLSGTILNIFNLLLVYMNIL